MGGAATREGVREKLLLLLRMLGMEFGVVWCVKNGNFAKVKRGRVFGGLVLGEESVSVVCKAEEECGSAINSEKKSFFLFVFLG